VDEIYLLYIHKLYIMIYMSILSKVKRRLSESKFLKNDMFFWIFIYKKDPLHNRESVVLRPRRLTDVRIWWLIEEVGAALCIGIVTKS
jgi:hypothetical protein